MQRCSVMVRIGGDLLTTVEKHGVSPAEVMVLRHIHGNDAVLFVRHTGNDRGKQDVNEVDRLQRDYGPYFREVFGGSPRLPDSFADVGFEPAPEDDGEAVAPRRGRKPKSEAAGVEAVSADDLAAEFGAE